METMVHGSADEQGLLRELNPGPLAPEARIMPLDQAAKCLSSLHKALGEQFCSKDGSAH